MLYILSLYSSYNKKKIVIINLYEKKILLGLQVNNVQVLEQKNHKF